MSTGQLAPDEVVGSRPGSRLTQSRPGSAADRPPSTDAYTTNGVTMANDHTDDATEQLHPFIPQSENVPRTTSDNGDAFAAAAGGGARGNGDPFSDDPFGAHPAAAGELATEGSVYSNPEFIPGNNPFVPFHRRKSDPGEKTGTPSGVAPGVPPLNLRRMGSSTAGLGKPSMPPLAGSNSGLSHSGNNGSMLERRNTVGLERKSTMTINNGPSMEELTRVNSAIGRRASLHSQLARSNPKEALQRSGSMATNPLEADAPPKILSFQPQRDVNPGEGGYSTEDREAAAQAHQDAEQLFMPSLQREQYVPVRVARDKIKQVLSEMAQMKTMHLAALDTMEKQHAFLKAQMESAVATYTKKLTTDYNNRVTALESEYKKRLSNLNNAAMGDLHTALEKAKTGLEAMERNSKARLEEKDRELEQERKMFQMRIDSDRQHAQKLQDEVERATKALQDREDQIAVLKGQVAALQAATDEPDDNARLIQQLREHNRTISAENEDLRRQRVALEQRVAEVEDDNKGLQHELDTLRQQLTRTQDRLASFKSVNSNHGGGGGSSSANNTPQAANLGPASSSARASRSHDDDGDDGGSAFHAAAGDDGAPANDDGGNDDGDN